MATGDKVKGRGRGFASMDPERRREIAAKGGRAVDPAKRSFSQNRELARSAGSKGGKRVPADKRSFALDKDLARRAGKKGYSKKGPPA
jgi:uncharacterized protein